MNFLASPQIRRYLYRVLVAFVGIFVGFNGWEAVTQQDWLALGEAILGVGTAAGFVLADINVPNSDEPARHAK